MFLFLFLIRRGRVGGVGRGVAGGRHRASAASARAGVLSLCPIADHLNEDADKQDPNRRGKKNGWPHSVIPFFFGGVDRPFID